MNFALFSIILLCSVQIAKSDRFSLFDLSFLMWGNLTFFSFPNKSETCMDEILRPLFIELSYTYFLCNPSYKPTLNLPISTVCPGVDCWESQLSLVTRLQIVDIMNKYRVKVATGKCLRWCQKNKNRVIFELAWNYFLELNATQILQTCSRNLFINKTYRYATVQSENLPQHAFQEIVATSFKMETGLQSELRSKLWRLMYGNHLKDWDEKRGVTFLTDLNETVENGIVGHFACIFATLIVDDSGIGEPRPAFLGRNPSYRNCESVFSYAGFNLNSYYPTLCLISAVRSWLQNQYVTSDGCAITPRSHPQLCKESKYSPVTWDEKFYGVILAYDETFQSVPRIPFPETPFTKSVFLYVSECTAPVIPPSENETHDPNQLNYWCTLKEVVSVNANTATCFGWNCADSQLTDATRISILERLNYARSLIAGGQCSEYCPHPCKRCNPNVRYCNMVNLQWHWFLERKAAEVVENCPTNNSIRKNFTYDDEPFPVLHETSYEEITLVFDLPYFEGQLALPETFEKLFWMNAFEDWNEYNYFRRANAQFIGCAIVSRPYTVKKPEIKPEMNFYNGLPAHMVCIYATLNGSFNSLLGENLVACCPICPYHFGVFNPCWISYTKEQYRSNALCSNDLFLITQNCQTGKCCYDDSISKAWYVKYEGRTTVQTLNGSLILLLSEGYNSIGIRYERAYCRFMVFLFVPQILLWIVILYLILSLQDVSFLDHLKESVSSKFKFRYRDVDRKNQTFGKDSASGEPSGKKSAKETKDGKTSEEISEGTPLGASTQSPVSKGTPPGASTQSPVSKGTPPGASTQSPVSKGTPPGASTQSPVSKGTPPGASTQSPVSKGTPPGASTQSPGDIRSKGKSDRATGLRGFLARKLGWKTSPPEIQTTSTPTQTTTRKPTGRAVFDYHLDDDDDDEAYEYVTGPTVTVGIQQVGPRRVRTLRPQREKKTPKRAKKTTVPPVQKKK